MSKLFKAYANFLAAVAALVAFIGCGEGVAGNHGACLLLGLCGLVLCLTAFWLNEVA